MLSSKESVPFAADTAQGLSASQVEESRRRYGENIFTHQKRQNFIRQYLASFGDPIIKILMAALAINIIFMFRSQNWFETVGIAVAVFLATFVSTLSEYGSESAFIRLQQEASKITCRVRRKEGLLQVPIVEVVVDDLVLLQAGEKVPADGIIISGELHLDQSAINGESAEVIKIPQRTVHTDWSPANKNQLFRGTVVASGEGVMQVKNVGDRTLYGSLAQELQTETVESPMKVRLAQLAGLISRLGYTAAILVALADLYNAIILDNGWQMAAITAEVSSLPVMLQNLMHAILLAISVVVVAVPEGLPMMITVVLSSNMLRMQKDNVMVRKLVGIETAGSLNILFTDKTGTLTTGNLSVAQLVTGDGRIYERLQDFGKGGEMQHLVGMSCHMNSAAALSMGKAIGGNSTERALIIYASTLEGNFGGCRKLRTVPFDSTNKYSWEKIRTLEKEYILVKGAPEKLLPRCTGYYDQNGIRKDGIPAVLHRQLMDMTHHAMRVLLLATADMDFDKREAGLTLVALAGIRDSLRPEVKRAVRTVREAGIQTVMITGDNRETAVEIAGEAGLYSGGKDELVLTSEELGRMDDMVLCDVIPRLRVVARALPADKSRLVRLSQELGLVVGMTGDGINDAPALKKADVGFAMGSGTEVAKEAGDIVILDNNFASITRAILYGRTIFRSIRKFLVFQLTMNLCAVGVSLIGPFIGVDTPVTVMQMLWINIIMDTLAGLAFAGESPQEEYMKEAPKSRAEPILNSSMLGQILITGGYTILLSTAFLWLPQFRIAFHFEERFVSFMTAFFTLFIFCGIFNAFNARTSKRNLLSNLGHNPSFVGIMAVISVVQFFMIYCGGELFRTKPLSVREIAVVLVLASTVIPFDILRKSIKTAV